MGVSVLCLTEWHCVTMVEREQVVEVRRTRVPDAAVADVAAAANAVVSLGDEWREVEDLQEVLGPQSEAVACADSACLVERLRQRVGVKLLQRVSR